MLGSKLIHVSERGPRPQFHFNRIRENDPGLEGNKDVSEKRDCFTKSIIDYWFGIS